MIKQNRAITLIALIITIIILLILAGVAINMVLGENGLFNKSKSSVEKYENAQEEEYNNLNNIAISLDNYIKSDEKTINDTFANKYYADGRKLYRKTIEFKTASTAGTYETGFQFENIDNIENISVATDNSYLYTDSGSTYAQLNTYYTQYAYLLLWYDEDNNKLMYNVGSQYVNSDAHVEITYTYKNDEIIQSNSVNQEQFTGMYHSNGKKIYTISKEFTTDNTAGSSKRSGIFIADADAVFIDIPNSYLYNPTTKKYSSINTHYSDTKYMTAWFYTRR